jgi:hypothetical protein
MGTSHTTGSKYLENNQGSALNIFLMTNERRTKELNENKKLNKIRVKIKQPQNERALIIKQYMINWHMSTMHNINKSRVSLLK